MAADNLYAGTIVGGIFRSSISGGSWTGVNSGLTNNNVRALVVSGADVFATTDSGVFLSTNEGASWSPGNIIPSTMGIKVISRSGWFGGQTVSQRLLFPIGASV